VFWQTDLFTLKIPSGDLPRGLHNHFIAKAFKPFDQMTLFPGKRIQAANRQPPSRKTGTNMTTLYLFPADVLANLLP
jgi:hypothetical protein